MIKKKVSELNETELKLICKLMSFNCEECPLKMCEDFDGHQQCYYDLKGPFEEILNKEIEVEDYGQRTIDEVLSVLNQYNIITAPKSIKLSEIVDRLNERLKEELEDSFIKVLIKRDETKKFITVFYKDTSYKVPSETIIFSFWNNDIIGMPEHTSFKWLYELWIAGTIIEDDLKECD